MSHRGGWARGSIVVSGSGSASSKVDSRSPSPHKTPSISRARPSKAETQPSSNSAEVRYHAEVSGSVPPIASARARDKAHEGPDRDAPDGGRGVDGAAGAGGRADHLTVTPLS